MKKHKWPFAVLMVIAIMLPALMVAPSPTYAAKLNYSLSQEYTIVNYASNKALNVYANPGAAISGSKFTASKKDGTNEQKFRFDYRGNSEYHITSLSNTLNLCVDVKGVTVIKDAEIHAYGRSNTGQNIWYLDHIGDESDGLNSYMVCIIRNKKNENLVLTPSQPNADPRSDMVVQEYKGYNYQKWKLIPATVGSSLKITSTYPSGTRTQGSTFSISGSVTSNYKITDVYAECKTTSGTIKFSKRVNPSATSYSLANLDSAMTFASLSAGDYSFKITATDSSGKTITAGPYAFKVAAPTWMMPAKGTIGCLYLCNCSTHKGTHSGIDIKSTTGTPVVASAGGTATFHKCGHADSCPNKSCTGNYVLIDHGGGIVTGYYHLRSVGLVSGPVSKGQQIGQMGSTGNSSGPHLHFLMKINGNFVNPSNYLPKM
ncbi:MAG: peptidoglycan DD-metalloendopeptidase family protein [Peptococcaceae bacterium]|nr:peptidoglycan DD-metalloendopeptidase family protein [Peptococcaceae bacterium]